MPSICGERRLRDRFPGVLHCIGHKGSQTLLVVVHELAVAPGHASAAVPALQVKQHDQHKVPSEVLVDQTRCYLRSPAGLPGQTLEKSAHASRTVVASIALSGTFREKR